MAAEANETIPVPQRSVDRWEYLDERIDFGQVWLERDSLPRFSKLKGRASGSRVALSQVKFYFISRDNSDKMRAERDLWRLTRPILAERFEELAKREWEAATPLDESVVEKEFGQDTAVILAQLLLVVATVGLAYVLIFRRREYYYRPLSATLPLRRPWRGR